MEGPKTKISGLEGNSLEFFLLFLFFFFENAYKIAFKIKYIL